MWLCYCNNLCAILCCGLLILTTSSTSTIAGCLLRQRWPELCWYLLVCELRVTDARARQQVLNIEHSLGRKLCFMLILGIAEALIQDNCSLSPNAEVVAGAVLRPPKLRLKYHFP